jgi:hypothetical protein
MGYVVRKISYVSRPWRVNFQNRAGGTHKETCIPQTQWRELGIFAEMTLDEVKARVRQLNAMEAVERRGAKRQKIDARLKEEALVQHAFLPIADQEAFEHDELFRRKQDPKLRSHWTAVKDLLCELKLEPQDYEYNRTRFYDVFEAKKYSISYVQKLIPIINAWGRYQARKYRLAFLPLPHPQKRERQRIEDAYFTKNPAGRAPSAFTPKMLQAAGSHFPPAQYNWLYLSVWFGLRPEEIDNIGRGLHHEVKRVGDVTVLSVYQTKLTAIGRDDRWKLIPVTCPEQELGIKIIKGRDLRRPLTRKLVEIFGPRVGLRSGRKNFTDMMLDKGHPLEDISAWLGHSSIARTWKHYRNRQKLRFTKRAA